MIHRPTALVAAPFAVMLAAGAATSESRQLDAHQHGHGSLNMAFEGSFVALELEAPGADIVGFEHPAETAEDRALIDAAIAKLAKPLDLFMVPAAAGCVVTAANVALIGDDHEDKHGHKDHHDEDHADHKDEHEDHADHKDEHAEHEHEEHGDEHANHADHAEEEGKGHTEFHAEYMLNCSDPAAIDTIEFAYFSQFPNAQELDIQMISDKGAKGFEVERDEPSLSLAGAI